MQHRVVTRSLLVVVASLSVAAVGCGATGGSDGTAGAQQVSSVAPEATSARFLAQSAQTTGAVTSERFEITVSTTPADGDPSVSLTSTGEVDGANGLAHVTADLSGSFGEQSGETSIEAIYDGDTVYAKAPFFEMFSEGKPWVKVTSAKLAEALARFDGSVQADPDELLAFLEGAGGEVTTIGTEDVRGVATRHVSVGIDITKVLEQAPPERRQQLEDHLTAHGISLDDLAPIPAEAWIDDDGYVRRFSVSFDLSELAKLRPDSSTTVDTTPGPVVTETIELFDFNEPIDVAIPAADEVHELDLSGLFGD